MIWPTQKVQSKTQILRPEQLEVGKIYRQMAKDISGGTSHRTGALKIVSIDLEHRTFNATMIASGVEDWSQSMGLASPIKHFMADNGVVAYNERDPAYPQNQAWNESNYLVPSDLDTELSFK